MCLFMISVPNLGVLLERGFTVYIIPTQKNVILSNYYALSNRHRSRLDVWCKTICSNGN